MKAPLTDFTADAKGRAFKRYLLRRFEEEQSFHATVSVCIKFTTICCRYLVENTYKSFHAWNYFYVLIYFLIYICTNLWVIKYIEVISYGNRLLGVIYPVWWYLINVILISNLNFGIKFCITRLLTHTRRIQINGQNWSWTFPIVKWYTFTEWTKQTKLTGPNQLSSYLMNRSIPTLMC